MAKVRLEAEERMAEVRDNRIRKDIAGIDVYFGERQAAVVVYCSADWNGVPIILDPPNYAEDMVVPVIGRKVENGWVYVAVFPVVDLGISDSKWKDGLRHATCELYHKYNKREKLTLFGGHVAYLIGPSAKGSLRSEAIRIC